ncbi:MAG: XdhC family protein [Deltaproteobacteria bacterium]|nr:XdhC family protein [Deltaproteobacteria bacterium]
MVQEIIDVIAGLRAQRRSFAVATVVETAGSTSAKTGAKAVISDDGKIVAGWVGGGCAESTTAQQALHCIATGEPAIVDIDLNDEILGAGMPCGGSMRVYVEPILPKPNLWILGHGLIAQCLCAFANAVGFEVIINDPAVERAQYPAAGRLITDDLDYEQFQPQSQDFVVIATQHRGDHESIKHALRSPTRYIALIASRKRSRLVMDYLRDEGVAQDDLARVRAPAGLDLGARTPEEIALSIISEIVLIRRGGTGAAMCTQSTEASRAGHTVNGMVHGSTK